MALKAAVKIVIDIEESDTRLLDLCFQASLSIQIPLSLRWAHLSWVPYNLPPRRLHCASDRRIGLGVLDADRQHQRILHSSASGLNPSDSDPSAGNFYASVLPIAVWRAHKHDVVRNRRATLGLFEFLLLAQSGDPGMSALAPLLGG